jgi:hypothetical protein
VPVDGIVERSEISFFGSAMGGVSLSEGVSRESELNLEVRFAGPRRVNLPLLG